MAIAENTVAAHAFAAGQSETTAPAGAQPSPLCYHCGTPCGAAALRRNDKAFCCHGCRTVFELLTENGLGHFYDLGRQAGIRVARTARHEQFKFLDEPSVRERLLDYSDAKISKVTFHIPSIHCIACVWLLENLFRLQPGVGRSQVNFPKKEVSVTFDIARVPLSELVALLSGLGYEPALNLAHLDERRPNRAARRLWLQIGVAGFAFGNIMLFSFPLYLGLEGAHGPALQRFFGYLSLALALPVLGFSAGDYWRSAWLCLRQRMLTIDLPIAAGLVALFAQSAFEIVSGRGEGYLDSMTGLIFFLLGGKVFQQKTYDRLSFDRDYKSFFPLSVVRKGSAGEETVSLSRLAVGDQLVLHHGELIPADARLLRGEGLIDYSFVTGESEPVPRKHGDYLYAGGQQVGGVIELEMVKPVSQGYLTSLWAEEAFAKRRENTLDNLTNRFSRRFTVLVAVVAIGAGIYWFGAGESARAMKAFTSVLIVACPCALALAAPFALGTAQRRLARQKIFLKNQQVTETLARVNTVVFDKTGTLTGAGSGGICWHGRALSDEERRWIHAVARPSMHPHSLRLAAALRDPVREETAAVVESFREFRGRGTEGRVVGRTLWLGSSHWLSARGVRLPANLEAVGSSVHVAIDGIYRGHFQLSHALRPQTDRLIRALGSRYELALLSGDAARERARFRALFGPQAPLHFNQSPLNKLGFIRDLRQAGRTVMMVGDGLNDAGALKESDAGMAVVENIGAFSPASDVIIEAQTVPRLPEVLRFARATVKVVRLSFLLSTLYNVIGISIAARGLLSPLVCAVLMPLSSASVVAFACGATHWMARRARLNEPEPAAEVASAGSEETAA